MIASIQRGLVSVNAEPVDDTLSQAVDLSRSMVLPTYRSNWASVTLRTPRVWLHDTTTVRIESENQGSPDPDVAYEVVEFESGIGVDVQRGLVSVASGGFATEDITINSVDLDRTIVLVSARCADGNYHGVRVSGWLTSATNLRITGTASASEVAWQVVQLPTDCFVQQEIFTSSDNTASSHDITLTTSAPTDRSFVIHNQGNSGQDDGEHYTTSKLLDADTVRLELLAGDTATRRYGIFVVTLPTGAEIQRFTTTQSGSNSTINETLSPAVDLGATTIMGGCLGYGRMDEDTFAYRCAATMELTSDTNLAIKRDQNGTETATWEIEVVTWPSSGSNDQQLTVDSVVHVGGWEDELGSTVAADIASSMGGATADDNTYAISGLSPSNSPVVAKLSTANTPDNTSDPHTYTFRYRKDVAGGEDIQFTVEIREGWASEPSSLGTLIHTDTVTATTDTVAELAGTLLQTEVDNIIDYGDLYVRIVANAV